MTTPYESTQAVSNDTNLQPPSTIQGYVPPLPGVVPGPADIQNALAGWAQRELAKQPWWRKSANTVSASIGMAGTGAGALATFYLTQGTAVPQWLTLVIAGIGFVATTIGVKNTKNGFTYQGAAKVQQAILDPAVLATVQKTLAQEPFPVHAAEAAIEQAAREAQKWINQNQTNSGSQG